MKLLLGDCLEQLKNLPDNSIDSVVTDPPYGLSFMGKRWDYDVPSVEIWRECLRVLKPGGHLLAFGGTRTYHRLVVNIEDAGFEVRDQLQWLYGQGFPKSLDISKAIDKAAGAEREVIGFRDPKGSVHGNAVPDSTGSHKYSGELRSSEAVTPEAKHWSGWGTALKPANEPICLARKPLIGTVAENVLTHGTGGLNIDGCRIETTDNLNGGTYSGDKRPSARSSFGNGTGGGVLKNGIGREYVQPLGRFPSNVLFDEDAAAALDEQSVERGIHSAGKARSKVVESEYSASSYDMSGARQMNRFDDGDKVGASRFFYVAKASKKDRGQGNTHPTVKPTSLMQYLVKLVTPPGGTVLDPFMGSGTTGVAAKAEGFDFIGCEMSEDYLEIAKARIKGRKASA